MVLLKNTENNKKMSKVLKFEEFTNNKIIPIYQPTSVYAKIKARRFSTALNNHLSVKEFIEYLDKGHRVVRFKSLKGKTTTVEEELLRVTHKLVVMELKNGSEMEFLVPVDKSASFRQVSFKYVKVEERYFYKCVSDANGMALLKFKYTSTEDHLIINFTVFGIDNYTMKVRKHEEKITLNSSDDFKFDIRLKCGRMCIMCPYQNQAFVLNFNEPSLGFFPFTIQEDLTKKYDIDMSADYLSITTTDCDFEDSVFSIKDVSKRLISYYFLQTGQRFDSKTALTDISDLIYLEHPSDVIYLNTDTPMWLVLEWLLPETSLLKLIFCGVSDGYVSHIIKEIDFSELFSEYKTFFKNTNEDQYKYEYCHMTSQLFLWTSRRHIIVVNTKTFEVESLLELKTERYFDFKNDSFQFIMRVSRDGKEIDVFVKKGKDVQHFEQFMVPSLNTLKLKTMSTVTALYSKYVIDNMNIQPSLKREILLSY